MYNTARARRPKPRPKVLGAGASTATTHAMSFFGPYVHYYYLSFPNWRNPLSSHRRCDQCTCLGKKLYIRVSCSVAGFVLVLHYSPWPTSHWSPNESVPCSTLVQLLLPLSLAFHAADSMLNSVPAKLMPKSPAGGASHGVKPKIYEGSVLASVP